MCTAVSLPAVGWVSRNGTGTILILRHPGALVAPANNSAHHSGEETVSVCLCFNF